MPYYQAESTGMILSVMEWVAVIPIDPTYSINCYGKSAAPPIPGIKLSPNERWLVHMSGCEQVQQAARMVSAVQRLPAPRLSEYPAFRRDHWRMGRPLVRN